ncbi:hypothetical protein PG996_011248 [Apiospora saccharicola]|uniref:Uncharacterized protein n=1 Tax=Apiospora saccharicola TaxID=335842 RepID=A0ABR1UEK7_9PEZI
MSLSLIQSGVISISNLRAPYPDLPKAVLPTIKSSYKHLNSGSVVRIAPCQNEPLGRAFLQAIENMVQQPDNFVFLHSFRFNVGIQIILNLAAKVLEFVDPVNELLSRGISLHEGIGIRR